MGRALNTEQDAQCQFRFGKTPTEPFPAAKKLADEKMLDMLLAGSAAENASEQAVG